jgi:hypothetical protein
LESSSSGRVHLDRKCPRDRFVECERLLAAKGQNIRRHEDLENAIFTCSGWLFEHKVSFKYSASGEEANTVRLFSSVTVVSMGWLLTFRKADHEANPIPGCGNCAAAVISY